MSYRFNDIKKAGDLLKYRANSSFSKGVFKRQLNPVVGQGLTKELLWKKFIRRFESNTGKKFIRSKDNVSNLEVLFQYFLGDKDFLTNPKVIKDGVEPSFDKGLLIIGSPGIGKTSYMLALSQALRDCGVRSFSVKTTNSLVQSFENCTNQNDRKYFCDNVSGGVLMLDDLGTERDASNYGKFVVVKDILESRDFANCITFATCNYAEGCDGDIEGALEFLGQKYGSRVYDRLFGKFNIVQFTGKSMRR